MPKQFKFNLTDLCTAMHYNNYECISGKWYKEGKELRNPRAFIARDGYLELCGSIDKLDSLLEAYNLMYGQVGWWPELPILNEARQILKMPKKDLPDLPIELTLQQKIIIRCLLEQKDNLFIICGAGGSGKSTFLNLIRQIFDNDYVDLSLDQLANPFELATGVTHRLISSTEINTDNLDNGKLKQLVSHEVITVNHKHQEPYQVQTQSQLIFVCNKPPRMDLSDTGLLRRIIYYGMEKPIAKPDPTIATRKFHSYELALIVAECLRLDLTDWKEYFITDTRYYLSKYHSVYRANTNSYPQYRFYCQENGYKALSRANFEEIYDLFTEWGVLNANSKGETNI